MTEKPVTENLYAAPEANPSSGETIRYLSSPRGIVSSWERLRLIYNAVLAGVGTLILIASISKGFMPIGVAATSAISVAIMANLAFFLGPLSEVYLCAIRDEGELPVYRKGIFIVGMIFSLCLFLYSGSIML